MNRLPLVEKCNIGLYANTIIIRLLAVTAWNRHGCFLDEAISSFLHCSPLILIELNASPFDAGLNRQIHRSVASSPNPGGGRRCRVTLSNADAISKSFA